MSFGLYNPNKIRRVGKEEFFFLSGRYNCGFRLCFLQPDSCHFEVRFNASNGI